MSIHASLRSDKTATTSLRSVLKRHERVRHLMAQGQWTEGRSPFGLPKLKQTKVKVRKAAAKEKDEAAAAGTTLAPSASAS